MASNRAAKSGVALDAQEKVKGKWDPELAKTAINWIGQRIGEPLSTDGSMKSVHEILENGVVLAKLANWVKPGSVSPKKYEKCPNMAFKKMELIGMFLSTLDEGKYIKTNELFQTVDLYEEVNMVQVINTIAALGRKMNSDGREGFGKAESKGEAREWTEEQLKAGQNIIGLQMGSNKGASQAGQNFGKTRAIVD